MGRNNLSIRYPDLYSADVGRKLQSVVDVMVHTSEQKQLLLAHPRPSARTRRTIVEMEDLLDTLLALQLSLVDEL